ncbi:MAG TPA: hypothetical protein VMH38_08405 [Thermoplasmata archaeon]|nr:hypothetical protein [Thermoplasmata archaeon]
MRDVHVLAPSTTETGIVVPDSRDAQMVATSSGRAEETESRERVSIRRTYTVSSEPGTSAFSSTRPEAGILTRR